MSHNDVHASLNAWQGFLSTICQYSTRISWFVCHLSLFTSQTRPVLLLFLLFSPLLWIYGLCQRIYGLCQRISLIRVFPSSRMSLKWAWLNESKERTAALIKIKQYRLGSEFLEILKTSRFSLPVIRLFFFALLVIIEERPLFLISICIVREAAKSHLDRRSATGYCTNGQELTAAEWADPVGTSTGTLRDYTYKQVQFETSLLLFPAQFRPVLLYSGYTGLHKPV